MSSRPLLSIIIPVYNVELYVEDAIGSVLEQEFENYEIIVINDGSTDETVTHVKKIMLRDKRIRMYHQENRGLAASRNRGLDLSVGDYVYFLDADDMLKANTLLEITTLLQRTKSDLVYFPGQFLDKDGDTIPDKPDFECFEQSVPVRGEVVLAQLIKNGCYSPNVQKYIYTKKFLLNSNLRFEDGFSHEDEAFSIKALCLADRSVSFRRTMMYKRLRPHSIMSSEKALHNVRGWLQAASTIILFSETRELMEVNRQFIYRKAKSLILTAKKVARKIGTEENTQVSIYDHMNPEALDILGRSFKIRLKYDRFFSIIYKVTP